jgi:tetratricopeptide (TPR) repeat protein
MRALPAVTPGPLRDLVTQSPVEVIGILLVGTWITWAWLDGGVGATRWGPVGMLVLLLCLLSLAARRTSLRRSDRLRWAMLAALAGFVAWNFLSILWADQRGEAWTGADRSLIYAATFGLFAAWPWSARWRIAILAAFTLGVAGTATAQVVQVSVASDALPFFEDGRLIGPTGYSNGSVGLWMLAFWPAIYLGSTRALPIFARPIFLAGATLLLELSVLGQSRAWIVILPFAALLYIALARRRLRALFGMALAGVATAGALRPLLDVFERSQEGLPLEGAVDRAMVAMLVSCLAVAAITALWAAIDSTVLAPQPSRLAAIVTGVVIGLGSIAGVAVAAMSGRDPGAWFSERIEDVKEAGPSLQSSRLGTATTGPTNRYEAWRVAWDEFLEHPATGIGTENFAVPYLERREDAGRNPRHPHSTPLRVMSQLGIVGTALFVTVLAIALLLALRQRRELDSRAGGACAAALMVFVYWLLHGSVDIFWELPALGAPAWGLLGLAGALSKEKREPPAGQGTSRLGSGVTAGIAVVLVAGCVALSLPWLAASYTESALGSWRGDPDRASERLEAAAGLNPLNPYPLLLEATLAMRRGELDRAEATLTRALDREPSNWFAHLELALVSAKRGDYDAAVRSLERARALNPREPGVRLAQELITGQLPFDLGAFVDLYVPDDPYPSGIAFETGFEEGAIAASELGFFDDVETPAGASVSASADRARTGRYALRVAYGPSRTFAMRYATRHHVRQAVMRFSFLLEKLPDEAVPIGAASIESPAYAMFRVRSDGTLEASAKDESGAGGVWVAGPKIQPGRWYQLDARYDTSQPTLTLEWMVDGVPQTTAEYEDEAHAAWPAIWLGSIGEGSEDFTIWYDDVAASTDPSLYPLPASLDDA